GISAPLWVTLERGYEVRQGQRLDANPRPETVVKAARAVGLDIDEALGYVGHTRADVTDPELRVEMELPPATDLTAVSDEELLAEVGRRIKAGARRPPSQAEREANPERFAVVTGKRDHREPGRKQS
ncbi:MAG: hypothetical protein QOF58_7788, partial [Pseudonocardiales bacterium]|nr:hypothetical protein [Pseudonocardiales bacterium]